MVSSFEREFQAKLEAAKTIEERNIIAREAERAVRVFDDGKAGFALIGRSRSNEDKIFRSLLNNLIRMQRAGIITPQSSIERQQLEALKQRAQPTQTELALGMSLPQALRNQPIDAVRRVIPSAVIVDRTLPATRTQPTATEEALKQSLPTTIRNQPLGAARAEIARRQADAAGQRQTQQLREQKEQERLFTPAPTQFKPKSGEFLAVNATEANTLENQLPKNNKFIRQDGVVVGIRDTKTKQNFGLGGIEGFLDQGSRERRTNLERVRDGFEREVNSRTVKLTRNNPFTVANDFVKGFKQGGIVTAKGQADLTKAGKNLAKSYEDLQFLGLNVAARTIYDLGAGGKQLGNQLWQSRNDPATVGLILASLPVAVLDGIQSDLERVFSGDPLEIYKVGAENLALAGVFKAAGYALSRPAKGIANALKKVGSPYLNAANRVFKTTVKAPTRVVKAGVNTRTAREIAALSKILAQAAKTNPVIKRQLDAIKKGADAVKNQRLKLIRDGKKSIGIIQKDIETIRKLGVLATDKASKAALQTRLALQREIDFLLRKPRLSVGIRKRLQKIKPNDIKTNTFSPKNVQRLADNFVGVSDDAVFKQTGYRLRAGDKTTLQRLFVKEMNKRRANVLLAERLASFKTKAAILRNSVSTFVRDIINKFVANVRKDLKASFADEIALVRSITAFFNRIKKFRPLTKEELKQAAKKQQKAQAVARKQIRDLEAKGIKATAAKQKEIIRNIAKAIELRNKVKLSLGEFLELEGIIKKQIDNIGKSRTLAREAELLKRVEKIPSKIKVKKGVLQLKKVKKSVAKKKEPAITPAMKKRMAQRRKKRLSERRTKLKQQQKVVRKTTNFRKGLDFVSPEGLRINALLDISRKLADDLVNRNLKQELLESTEAFVKRRAIVKQDVRRAFEVKLRQSDNFKKLREIADSKFTKEVKNRKIRAVVDDVLSGSKLKQAVKSVDSKVATKVKTVRQTVETRLKQNVRPKPQVNKIPFAVRVARQTQRDISNKNIDRLFAQMKATGNVPLTDLAFSQLRNRIKKRYGMAVRRGNQKRLTQMNAALKKMAQQINNKNNLPTLEIQAVKPKVTPKLTPKTKTPFNSLVKLDVLPKKVKIKANEVKVPRGTYADFKPGQTLLLKKTAKATTQAPKIKQVGKTARLTKQTTKQVKLITVSNPYKVVKVSKKALSLAPLYGFLFGKAVSNTQAQALLQRSDVLSASDTAKVQVTKTATTTAKATATALKKAQLSAQRKASATASKKILRTDEPKKPKRRKITKKKVKKKVTGKKQTGYAVEVKRGGKLVRVTRQPLSLKDARDVLAKKLDTTLARSGTLVRLGEKRKLGKAPLGAKGSFAKVRKKLRDFRVKKGKKTPLRQSFIEKKRFSGDTLKEILELKRAKQKKMKTVKKKRVFTKISQKKKKLTVKRKGVVRKKPTKSLRKTSKTTVRRKPRKAPVRKKITKKR